MQVCCELGAVVVVVVFRAALTGAGCGPRV